MTIEALGLVKKIGGAILLTGIVAVGGCANHRPIIKPIPYQTVQEGHEVVIDLNQYISNLDEVEATAELVRGPGVITNNQFSYNNTFDNDHTANTFDIEFKVVNGYKKEANGCFEIFQRDVNRPPTIQPIQDQIMKEDEGFLPVDLKEYIFDPESDKIDIAFASGPAGDFSGTTFSLWTGPTDANLIDDEYTIGFVVKDNYGGESKSSFKLIKQDITTPSRVTDMSGQQYSFSRMQSDFLGIPCGFNRTAVAIESDEIKYLCDFKKIQKIERLKNGQVNVFLRDGESITGYWVSNNSVTNFYMDENNPIEPGSAFGLSEGKEVEIQIDNIKEVVFDEPEQSTPDKMNRNKKYPKRIELNNGTVIETNNGYIIDFCGHDWRSSHHTELENYFSLSDKNGRLDEIAEVVFTGNFHVDYDKAQCREIVLRYKNGVEEKGHLLLYSESQYGNCNSNPRFIDSDMMFAEQEYGAMLIPLNHVKKVVPLEVEKR